MQTHVTPERERELSSRRQIMLQWAGLLVPPLAFLLHLQLQYILVPFACDGTTLLLHLAALGMLLLAGGGGWLAWRDWERVGRGWPGDAGGTVPRSRFMAVLGIMTSALFLLAILAQWLPILFLGPCERW